MKPMTVPNAPRPANTAALLAPDEPPPFEVVAPSVTSPFLILCDHASRRIPRSLGALGLPDEELGRHIAWDIGVADLGRLLAAELGAWLILQNYSRLVIDCNRQLTHPDSITKKSEDTPIPGNQAVSEAKAQRRALEIFEPYHARIRRELDERTFHGKPPFLIFLHSFTPRYRGIERPWHAGVLSHRDTRMAAPLLEALRNEPGLVVGDNEPYAASAQTDYGIVEHAEHRGLLHVELEVRQDLLVTPGDLAGWSERLARLLRKVAA